MAGVTVGLVLTAALVATPSAADDSTAPSSTASAAKAKRVVLWPRPGAVVRSHRVRLRVRSRSLTGVLAARLNGVQVGDDFGRARRGVRTLRVSASHGLRRGRNVLRVRVRRRGKAAARATVRFFMRTRRPLVGAGRHRRVVVGRKARLSGKVKHAARPAARSKMRWTLVGGPRRDRVRAPGAGASRPLARLTSAAGLAAGFRPRVPGTYTVQLTHGAGESATSDRVTLDAVPRSPLVPVDTMVREYRPETGTQPGIRVGDTTYLLDDAGGSRTSYLQALALKRKTLGLVWNRAYNSATDLARDLDGLDDTHLVILVLQAQFERSREWYGDVNGVAGRIGVPDFGQWWPLDPGTVSAIGVPGMARGDADVNVVSRAYAKEPGWGMRGYLTPDQYLNYGFVPRERYAFSFGGKEVDPCQAGAQPPCSDVAGYRLNVKDSRSFQARPGDNRVYNTGGRGLSVAQQTAEANRMVADLNAVASEDVVMIQSVGSRKPEEAHYPPPVGDLSKDTMRNLAAAVAKVGGTRDAFNRTVRLPGVPSSGGAVYMLAGWAGAREGEGTEVAAGVEGAGNAPRLTFVMRPERFSRFRPTQATDSDKNTDALSKLMLAQPEAKWPLDDDPGARKAIAFLGSTDPRLGSDPRSAYWTQPLDQAALNDILRGLDRVAYQDGKGFTQAEFDAAREQLEQELRYVGNVRTYLANLSRPFAENALKDWTTAKVIANDIYKDLENPDEEVAFRWIEFTEILLELLGPLTEDVSAALGAALELGAWAYGATGGGSPTDREIRVEAEKLGEHLVEQAQQTQAMFARMGDVIVSDWSKLKELGRYGGCKPDPDPSKCPPAFSLTAADLVAASGHVYTSIRQTVYNELLPLAYRVFTLTRLGNAYPQLRHPRPTPPDPVNYHCDLYHPWYGYPPAASTSLLQELDPQGLPSDNGWDTFVLSRPPGEATQHGTPPSDELLRRAFGPISRSGDPKAGGAGASLARMAIDSKRYYWWGTESFEYAKCYWDE